MSNTSKNPRGKLSFDDVKRALHTICQENQSQNKILVNVREIQGILKYKYDIEVSGQAIRNKGVTHRGYFEKKYPEVFEYNHTGDTKNRGLIVKPEKYLEQVNV